MKLSAALPRKKGRIEIIPLIDIMFFLLASFMLASLSMMRLRSMEMALPTATAPAKSKPDVINLLVKPNGDLSVDETNYSMVDLERFLVNRFRHNAKVQVYIKGDPASTYGMFINALDLVKEAGISNVSCAVSASPKSNSPA